MDLEGVKTSSVAVVVRAASDGGVPGDVVPQIQAAVEPLCQSSCPRIVGLSAELAVLVDKHVRVQGRQMHDLRVTAHSGLKHIEGCGAIEFAQLRLSRGGCGNEKSGNGGHDASCVGDGGAVCPANTEILHANQYTRNMWSNA